MPTIHSLTAKHFRNLSSLDITLSPTFNLFHGSNGSGKTSILEAIYYLGLGRSFRSSHSTKIIQHKKEHFFVVAKLDDLHNAIVGIERHRRGARCIKYNGEEQTSIAAITKAIPMQFMSPISYRFFHDGPKVRRQFLDWLLFHVEPSFLLLWQHLQRLLKQRNSALRRHSAVNAWDIDFVVTAEKIDALRQHVFSHVSHLCHDFLQLLLPQFEFDTHYQRGWPNHTNLSSLLTSSLAKDLQLGYTYYGPQRADFNLLHQSTPLQDILSQGQQKLAAYALHLALGQLMQQKTGNNPIYLIDDLASELDASSRSKIIRSLTSLNAQVFITGTCQQDLSALEHLPQTRMFHVEHGVVHPVETSSTPLNSSSCNNQ